MKFHLSVNKILLPVKAHYFLYNAGTGAVVPFMSVFARHLGFSSVTVGIIYTISPIASMLTKPTMGAFADRFRCKKIVFLLSILLTAASVFVLNFSQGVPTLQRMRFLCNSTSTTMDTCADNFTVTDECAVESITTETGDTTVRCQMTCKMDSSGWNTICDEWGATHYCNSSSSTITFTANTLTTSAEKIGDCVVFQVDSINLDGEALNPSCSSDEGLDVVCDIACNAVAVNDLVKEATLSDDEVYGHYAFWVLLLIYVLIWVGMAVSVTTSDAICFELLGDEPHRYGYQRLWGAVGWGLFTLICGFIIDYFSQGKGTKNYAPVFYIGMATLIINFFTSLCIQYEQKHISPSILRDVGRVIMNVPILIFTLWCIFMGLCTAMVWNFLFWIMEDLAAAQGCDSQTWIKTLQGLAQAFQCLGGELPFFFFSGWILKKIGHVNCMTLITFVLGIRFTLYSVITNPWWFLPIELSNGITFGLFYATMASYASIIAPPGTEATAQGLAGAVFEGIGVSLGSLIGGVLIGNYGGPMTFRIGGIAAFIVCALHGVIQHFLQRRKDNKMTVEEKSS